MLAFPFCTFCILIPSFPVGSDPQLFPNFCFFLIFRAAQILPAASPDSKLLLLTLKISNLDRIIKKKTKILDKSPVVAYNTPRKKIFSLKENPYALPDKHADEYGYDGRHDVHVPYFRMLKISKITAWIVINRMEIFENIRRGVKIESQALQLAIFCFIGKCVL